MHNFLKTFLSAFAVVATSMVVFVLESVRAV